MVLKDWKRKNPKNVFILSKGAKEYALASWERTTPNKFGVNPAIIIIKNIGSGFNVQFYGVNKNKIKSFKTKQQALKYAKDYMKKV